MKRGSWLVIPALLAVVIPSLMAGGPGHKCTKTTEECLTAMTADLRNRGYVGIETEKDEASGAIRVSKVLPGTPAEAAGLQVGDVLVAMNGIRFADEKSKDALYEAKKSLKVGSQLTYTISRKGAERQVALKLASVPDDVLAQWVGHHMLEHAKIAVAQN